MADLEINAKITDVFRLTPPQKNAAERIGLTTLEDLFRHLPLRYLDAAMLKPINEVTHGEEVAVEGKVKKIDSKKAWRKKITMTEATIMDNTGELRATWFHQPYISKMLAPDDFVRLEGKAAEKNGKIYISNPAFEKISRPSYHGTVSPTLTPVYPATQGLSSRWIQYHIQKTFGGFKEQDIEDTIPQDILDRYHLPSLWQSLRAIHFPKNQGEVEGARKRLAFDEIFFIQLSRMQERMRLEQQSSLSIPYDKKSLESFLNQLPFDLTETQNRVLDIILEDVSRKTPMARLLEGDVGSGKTVIAAATAYLSTTAGFQTTYMAPTAILARQHFDGFCKAIGGHFTKIGLLTSSEARVFPSKAYTGQSAHISKSQMQKWLESGEIKILIGTHSLLNEKIKFKNLAFIVVDEQHRFGIKQRQKLARSKSQDHEFVPHFLSMTATPIPRTLALTVFGDLDLAVLDELPPGRSPIISEVLVKPKTRSWDHIRNELKKGRQAFIICPRIDEGGPDALVGAGDEKKSVKKEYENMSKHIFPEFTSGMLHGKMKPKEKENALKDFRDKKIDILIATSVVEVGIDIPNATVMVVEGADRFGLAQLHQLRGRIGRGEHQSYFYAVSDSTTQKTVTRLKSLVKAKSGFELAEYDLQQRGPGELTGKNQWGLSDVGMEALKNIKMVEAARTEARRILEDSPELKEYPSLKTRMDELNKSSFYHFE
ncbi:MAG: ATP-dependent DNA helicase RecG [bacterium]|nr:ATP-dependent DNA helicase RecG [bacterium]